MTKGMTEKEIAYIIKANEEWGFNCGPASLCTILGKTPDEIRPYLGDFEKKRYTNPSLMAAILRSMNVSFERKYQCLGANVADKPIYPDYGIVRIQWGGPWTKPGVPIRARYRHTHWIAVKKNSWGNEVSDVNHLESRWISAEKWESDIVPFILLNCESNADGTWWPTHCWEINHK